MGIELEQARIVTEHIASTWTATIWIGTKQRATGEVIPYSEILDVCHKFCDEIGLCVTVTPTEFVYTDGGEPGAAVGIINYPRFPKDPPELEERALELAKRLVHHLRQLKASVVMPERTVMFANRAEESNNADI